MGHWRSNGVKRDKYDILFSELVRERADWICEYCGNDFNHDNGRLHNSHVFGRRHKGVRIHYWNGCAHCYKCHPYLEENPIEFAEWYKQQFGEAQYYQLLVIANRPTKLTVFDKEVIHKHYLAEKRRMLGLRKQGVRGRIEFTMP
jgi:hypothetical protein